MFFVSLCFLRRARLFNTYSQDAALPGAEQHGWRTDIDMEIFKDIDIDVDRNLNVTV